jgi:hypothetical protein
MTIITILGSCRQHSLSKKYKLTSIQEEISYPHYTKEIIQLIKYCKYNNVSPDITKLIFRTPILTKRELVNYNKYNNEFNNTDIFIIEISSKIFYKYNDYYVHHIAIQDQYQVPIKNNIILGTLTKDDIEKDIIEIKNELNKPLIIISHLVTRQKGERYILSEWLEEICKIHKITFINPIKELIKNNVDLNNIFLKEDILAHYNDVGHNEILLIYESYINKIINNSQ